MLQPSVCLSLSLSISLSYTHTHTETKNGAATNVPCMFVCTHTWMWIYTHIHGTPYLLCVYVCAHARVGISNDRVREQEHGGDARYLLHSSRKWTLAWCRVSFGRRMIVVGRIHPLRRWRGQEGAVESAPGDGPRASSHTSPGPLRRPARAVGTLPPSPIPHMKGI